MSDKPENSPAFPNPTGQGSCTHEGMTLRDYFAAAALQAHMTDYADTDVSPRNWHDEVAKLSYQTADAMLKAREA